MAASIAQIVFGTILVMVVTRTDASVDATEAAAKFKPASKLELSAAVEAWIADKTLARETYGEINAWDTSLITDMSWLFHGQYTERHKRLPGQAVLYKFQEFNEPIGNWNTSRVTNMSNMFHGVLRFNQPIGNWDTSRVTDMSGMFYNARASIIQLAIGRHWPRRACHGCSAMLVLSISQLASGIRLP